MPCTASLAAVPPHLLPLLDGAVAAYRHQFGKRLVGVYLRGSMAQQGCFVPGMSDADFLALYLGDGDGGEAAAAVERGLRQAAQELLGRCPQCTKVSTS